MDVVLPATLYDCYIVSMEKSVYLMLSVTWMPCVFKGNSWYIFLPLQMFRGTVFFVQWNLSNSAWPCHLCTSSPSVPMFCWSQPLSWSQETLEERAVCVGGGGGGMGEGGGREFWLPNLSVEFMCCRILFVCFVYCCFQWSWLHCSLRCLQVVVQHVCGGMCVA